MSDAPRFAVLVRGLEKRFRARETDPGLAGAFRSLWRPKHREVVAVADLEFTIVPGERVAFVGPNGAGKSTTIKMLTGILHPTAGEATVLGHVPWKERRRLATRIGTVFGQRSQLWYHLPAREAYELLATMYALSQTEFRHRLEELVAAFQLEGLLSRPVRQLSLGQRMRCEIVASLLHRPEVLFLDEPTIGLDVDAKAVIRDLVRDNSKQDGSTVLLTSHDTGDMERVCDRVIVIDAGRKVVDAPIGELRSRYIRRKRITLVTAQADPEIHLPGVTLIDREPHRLRLEIDPARTPLEQVLRAALDAGDLRDLTVEDPPLDEIVQEIYSRSGGSIPPESIP